MTKQVVKTINHRSIVAEVIYVVYDHGDETKEKREFAGVRFKRTLPSGRLSVDFRSADLQDLIDCADKVRPFLIEVEEPIKKRITEAQEKKWKKRFTERYIEENPNIVIEDKDIQSDE